MHILGISAFYHDSAACLLSDGEIVAAAQEERFTRKKGDAAFPSQAAAYCLRAGGIGVGDLSYVGFYDKPLLKFERILETYLHTAPRGFASFLKAGPLWIKEKLFMEKEIRDQLGYSGPVLYAEHHESHAASAFYPSPFEEAAILTMDGVGEWATTSFGIGRGHEIELLREMHWPDSLGLLYSAFTYYTGFKVNSGEYKVMGLAPYGRPKYVDLILGELMDLREDGSFSLDQRYFDYLGGLTMTSPAFDELFGGRPRVPESQLTQREMDLARSVQEVCEEVMLRTARTVHRETGMDRLCLAGGVALNCVGNGRILREGPFSELWIQPAAGDAGGALGVAQLAWHRHLGKPRRLVPVAAPAAGWEGDGDAEEEAVPLGAAPDDGGSLAVAPAAARTRKYRDGMRGAYLGPQYPAEKIEAYLREQGAPFRRLPREELLRTVAGLLASDAVVGWFAGRMEFGPRALGGRSILGDPRSPRMQAQMNLKIKYRESFRPFAPSVLRERVHEYFEMDCDSPYMLLVAPVKEERRIPMTAEQERLWGIDRLNVPRSDLPAITHIDYSARIQTVSRDTSPEYHDLLREFERETGCAVLVNTSFNVRGEPIVCSPADAYRCFMRTEMDHLVLWPFLLDKKAQPEWREDDNWRTEFPLD